MDYKIIIDDQDQYEKIDIKNYEDLQLCDYVCTKENDYGQSYCGKITNLLEVPERIQLNINGIRVLFKFNQLQNYVMRKKDNSNMMKQDEQADHICKPKLIDHGFRNQNPWIVCSICGKEL